MGWGKPPILSNRFIGFFFQETVETVKGKLKLTNFPHDDPPGWSGAIPLDDVFCMFLRHNINT
jgi:hypothetical protein